MTYAVSRITTPAGQIEVAASLRGVVRVRFVTWPVRVVQRPLFKRASQFAEEACMQLQEYIAETRRVFNVPLDFSGSIQASVFKQRVWIALMRVRFGERVSYVDLARHIGRPGGQQAVGQAVKANPIAIIVPCHRVVPAAGLEPGSTEIGGYNGGVKRKAWLLAHEYDGSRLVRELSTQALGSQLDVSR